MTNSKTQGIFARKNRRFYYLETGNLSVRSPTERIKSLLIQRDVISYHRENKNDLEPDHKVMTLGEAQDLGIDIERIFLNKHIEAMYKEQVATEQKNPWL